MFKMKLAQYISDNMVTHQLTYKDIATRAGIPPTTLSYYARGQVNTPNDDYCIRIAAVFGDGPEVINDMRRAALGSTAKENEAIAKSSDVESAEKLAAIMRVNMLAVLDEYKSKAELEHSRRIETVKSQYEAHIRNLEARCEQRVSDAKAHAAELLDLERQHRDELRERNATANLYLKSCVRNLAFCCALFGIVAFGTMLYAMYAYHTFDVDDPTQGLYRGEGFAGPALLFLVVVLVVIAVSRIILILSKRPGKS